MRRAAADERALQAVHAQATQPKRVPGATCCAGRTAGCSGASSVLVGVVSVPWGGAAQCHASRVRTRGRGHATTPLTRTSARAEPFNVCVNSVCEGVVALVCPKWLRYKCICRLGQSCRRSARAILWLCTLAGSRLAARTPPHTDDGVASRRRDPATRQPTPGEAPGQGAGEGRGPTPTPQAQAPSGSAPSALRREIKQR